MIGRLGFVGLIVLGIISGLSSFLFINLTTRIIRIVSNGGYNQVSFKYLTIFIGIIFFIVLMRRVLSLWIIKVSQTIFWGLRRKILSIVLKADYHNFVNRKSAIHASVLGDVYVLTEASMSIIGFSTSLILGLSCFIYLATLSGPLFLITLGTTACGIVIYTWNSSLYNKEFTFARVLEHNFVENLNIIMNGFKEIYMEPEKGRYLYEKKINVTADAAYKHTTAGQIRFLNNQITGQVLFYMLVTSILLVFSVILDIDFGRTVGFVFSLFYLLGSVETIMILLPNLVRAKVAATQLMDLTEELEKTDFKTHESVKKILKGDLESIEIKGMRFNYGIDNGCFGIGPLDFELRKGDVVFIYGDNGSGKTTFVQSLISLHHLTDGEIRFNGSLIDNSKYHQYRTAFSVVFSDFYLFSEIFSYRDLDMEKWNYYVRLFELQDKVKLENRVFSTTTLSSGQRKRLALIANLFEEKPVLVLDEWAADQDPYFRKKFYTEILPALKLDGFTILAITHDDKYYHCADRLYRMDFGKLLCEADNAVKLNAIKQGLEV
jgi:putative ATP-binding cassette transporter